MERLRMSSFRRITSLLSAGRLDTAQQLARIESMERNIGLPVRAGLMMAAAYYVFVSRGSGEATNVPDVVLEFVRGLIIGYLALNALVSVLLFFLRDLGWGWARWVVFTISLVDGFVLAGTTLIAGGFDSGLYWFFALLLVRNAISVPVAALQILLNLATCAFYLGAALVDLDSLHPERSGEAVTPLFALVGSEAFILRVGLLLLLAICCYGVQVIYDRNLRAQDEARQLSLRQEQLRAAGRLAGEIAHQLKNPLSIINNAAFNLQKTMPRDNAQIATQLEIIREEVARSDRIISEVMGYAQLAEGHAERLDAVTEMETALERVFPSGLGGEARITTHFSKSLPPLLGQRHQLQEVFVNLLKNAKEATGPGGQIHVSIKQAPGSRIIVTVADNGPGISPQNLQRVFEAYFTTKSGGSGLGLAIVKQNVELFGGSVRAESELGRGARFILEFPTKITASA